MDQGSGDDPEERNARIRSRDRLGGRRPEGIGIRFFDEKSRKDKRSQDTSPHHGLWFLRTFSFALLHLQRNRHVPHRHVPLRSHWPPEGDRAKGRAVRGVEGGQKLKVHWGGQHLFSHSFDFPHYQRPYVYKGRLFMTCYHCTA